MTLEIPVTEGDQYRVGEVKFEGMTVFKEEGVRPLFKLQTGDVYKESRFKKGYDKLRDAYGSQGYFQWTVLHGAQAGPRAQGGGRHPAAWTRTSSTTSARIRFTGNDTTRDKVIRREVYLNEGDVFNTEALKLSIRRINQLGYFKPMEGPPQISAQRGRRGQARRHLQGRGAEPQPVHLRRRRVAAWRAPSSTRPSPPRTSWALGETFQISAQSGRRTKNYQIAITEPYLFDRPITAGFDLFEPQASPTRRFDERGRLHSRPAGAARSSVGPAAWAASPACSRNYSYEIIDIQGLDALLGIDPNGPTTRRRPARCSTPSSSARRAGAGRAGSRPPSCTTRSTTPTRRAAGVKLTSTFQVAGGPAGRHRELPPARPGGHPLHPAPRAHGPGHARPGRPTSSPYGDTEALPLLPALLPGRRDPDPRLQHPHRWARWTRTDRALGGNKYALFNAEYYFDIGGPLRFLFFFDAGQAFLEDERIDIKKFRTSTGAELRFIMPVLNVPFRLIYAFNPNRDAFQTKSTFKFAVGTTF